MIARDDVRRLDSSQIADFCRRHGITRLSVFGSVLREDFGPHSDIDILVEFPPGETPSLLDLGGMQVELSSLLGREVDLKTPGFLSPAILQHVLAERVVEYAA
jgi:predicted nucleotidyltransferase